MILTFEILGTGMLAAAFIIVGVFFLRFWRDTRDSFFLAFAASFLVKGMNTIAIVLLDKPNEGSPWNYIVGLCSTLLIIAAIVGKNLKSR